MRGVAGWGRRWPAVGVAFLAGLLLVGCKTVQGGPDRLYSVPEEVGQARTLLDDTGPGGIPGLVERYYQAPDDTQRMYWRNEIIARRMYIIDVEYSEYEVSLTSERQKFGFLTTAAAAALGIAATLTTPLRSAQLVAGAGAAVLATRGAYDSEIVIAKTIEIVQGHMRAQRDNVATTQILPRRLESALTYPLSAALHDLEDYYHAGTFTSGLIPALRESGKAAQIAADSKAVLIQGAFNPNEDTSRTLQSFLMPGGNADDARWTKFNGYLRAMGYKFDVGVILTNSRYAGIRLLLIQYARNKGVKI
jgi:hypothetical protein